MSRSLALESASTSPDDRHRASVRRRQGRRLVRRLVELATLDVELRAVAERMGLIVEVTQTCQQR